MELILSPESKPGLPLYRALSEDLRQTIVSQQLSDGYRLPSVRELAKHCNLSVATALRAYQELSSQGYVATWPKSGTRVSRKTADLVAKQPTPLGTSNRTLREPIISTFGQRLLSAEKITTPPRQTATSIPKAAILPLALWQRMLSSNYNCYQNEKALFDYSADPFGHVPLRQAIADYLERTRAIKCDIQQIAVTSAVRLDLACRMLINAGDDVALENPCFPATRKVFLSYGANVHPIDVDADGLNPDQLLAGKKEFRMLYLCPSHQDPTGLALTLERRRAILDWSLRTGTLIWENDFDCNYFYTDTPLPAIQSLSENDTVIYSGSFWLTLGPLVSSGFLVLPLQYVDAFRSLLSTVQSERPVLENYALAEFIRDGHFERHILKQRHVNLKLRQALIHSLSLSLRNLVSFKESSGMHILLEFDESLAEHEILKCAQEAGFALKSTRPYYANDFPVNQFILPFNELQDEMIPAAANTFSQLLLAIG